MDIKKFQKTGLKTLDKLSPKKLFSELWRLAVNFADYPKNFALGFLLSRGIILSEAAPFGIAFCAACGTSRGSIWALLGATFGYLTILDYVNSLKYIACIILTYTAHFVFKDTFLTKSPLFSPLSVFIPLFCVNLVFVADAGFPLLEVCIALSETLLAALCAFFLTVFCGNRPSSPIRLYMLGALVFSALLLLPLSGITLYGKISLGAILALFLALLSGYSCRAGGGAICGVALGTLFSLSSSSGFIAALPLGGIFCGVFASKGRFRAALFSILAALAAEALVSPFELSHRAPEILAAAAGFALLAPFLSPKLRRLLPSLNPEYDIHLREYAKKRLLGVSSAFDSLSLMLSSVSAPPEHEKENIATVFERASNKLCRKCTLSHICWSRDFSATKTAISDASSALSSRGELRASDFPNHFSSRCISISRFIDAVNREYCALIYRRQYRRRFTEQKELLKNQYSEVCGIFSSLADDISNSAKRDEICENEIRDLLASFGVLCEVAVYRDEDERRNVHLCGRDLLFVFKNFEKYRGAIASALGVSLDTPQYTKGKKLDDIIIRELPSLRATVGAAINCRSGSDISGDSGSFFYPKHGHLAVILSDGMGTGRLAADESASCILLLEKLLSSGISASSAVRTLNSALMIKSEQTGAFSTLDLCYADLFSKKAELFKLGGAPSYIKHGEKVKKLSVPSLPAGIFGKNASFLKPVSETVEDGDFLIMLSDGIIDGNDDSWLIPLLENTSAKSPKELSDEILAHSLTKFGSRDDMTVISVLFEKP